MIPIPHLGRMVPVLLAMSALTLVLVATNVITIQIVASQLQPFSAEQVHAPSIPCAAIPSRLVLEDPVCAQKLLEAMDVTNVRVRPKGSWPSSLENVTTLPVAKDQVANKSLAGDFPE